MVNYINWKFLPGDVNQFTLSDLDSAGNPTNTPKLMPLFIGPKAEIFGQTAEIPTARLDDVIAGRGKLLFWGWTSYNDVFEGTKRHQTRFSTEIQVKSISTDQGKIQAAVIFAFYNRGNCADEECESQGYGPPRPYPF
jgi:hypothetical protein